nr:dihydrofolate reductase [Actinomyces faecalis]
MHDVGAIWAQDRSGILGARGGMLWRVPADFRHFKAATLGGVVIMGRTTWDSIGAALPGRRSIVLTRQPGWSDASALVMSDLRQAVQAARGALPDLGPDPRDQRDQWLPRVWVIGGGRVYDQALSLGLVDTAVVSTLDLDVRVQAGQDAVHAPLLTPAHWHLDKSRSDPAGWWRPVSGDAAWRVDHWVRHESAS